MPAMQLGDEDRQQVREDLDREEDLDAITGIITFSSSWPASHAIAIVGSQPITWKQTWFTISGTDGIHLARHDRRARLHGRQRDLARAGARAHAEQAQVARDLPSSTARRRIALE